MKRLVILILGILMIGGIQTVQAEGKGISKAAYLAKMKKRMEATGQPFEQAKFEASFDKKDKNGDGMLTPEEVTDSSKDAPKSGKKSSDE